MDPQNEQQFTDEEVKALACADCARADNAVTDLEPSQVMPVPAEALIGFPDGAPEERRFSRRSLLKNGVAGMASVYAATRLDWGNVWEEVAAQAGQPMQPSVVMLYQNLPTLQEQQIFAPIGELIGERESAESANNQ